MSRRTFFVVALAAAMAAAADALTAFNETLSPEWVSFSYDGQFDFASQDVVRFDDFSIRADLEAFGALKLVHVEDFTLTGFANFWVRDGGGGLFFFFFFFLGPCGRACISLVVGRGAHPAVGFA